MNVQYAGNTLRLPKRKMPFLMSSNAPPLGDSQAPSIFVAPANMWIAFATACAALAIAFEPSLRGLIDIWFQSEEFGYGVILPFVCGFLIWQQRDLLERRVFVGSWWGVALLICAVGIALLGQGAAVPALAHYGLVFALAGLSLATTGWPIFRGLLGPFCILLLAIPLPAFLFNALSLEMQTLSAKIGILLVRMFDISVFLEGNVIDLGAYKLEVAEACSGLRYLFPLMTLGFVMAYLFKVSLWKRAALFLSSIPITILMNSVRIGIIGVMVDRWGVAMAEGFLHDFQGWAVFMASTGVMIVEMIALSRIGLHSRPWREVFGLEFPPPRVRNAPRIHRELHRPLVAAVFIAIAAAAVMISTPKTSEAVPSRESFVVFPSRLGAWQGQRAAMEPIYLDALKLDDYVLADYRRGAQEVVNFYVAWYDSQRSGQSAHSPRSCLPGGGWRIADIAQRSIDGVRAGDTPLRVNRVEIELGRERQLVYYWFQQRGRVITNEYMVKWYLFWDSLTRRRSDGSLVRLVTPLRNDETIEAADARLTRFAKDFVPELDRYIPR